MKAGDMKIEPENLNANASDTNRRSADALSARKFASAALNIALIAGTVTVSDGAIWIVVAVAGGACATATINGAFITATRSKTYKSVTKICESNNR